MEAPLSRGVLWNRFLSGSAHLSFLSKARRKRTGRKGAVSVQRKRRDVVFKTFPRDREATRRGHVSRRSGRGAIRCDRSMLERRDTRCS